jgi:hypothetical protein
MSRLISSIIPTGALLAIVGCGNASIDPASQDNEAPSNARAAQPSISLSGFVQAADGAPLDGVDVCIRSGIELHQAPDACTVSGADGSWKLSGVARNAQRALTFEKEGFGSALRVFETARADIAFPESEHRLVPLSASASFLGTPIDTKRGRVEFFVASSGGAAPRNATLTSMHGKSMNALYADQPSAEPNSLARGGFADLTTGEYMLVLDGGCAASRLYSYPILDGLEATEGVAIMGIPVIEGYVTTPVIVSCTGAAPPAGP